MKFFSGDPPAEEAPPTASNVPADSPDCAGKRDDPQGEKSETTAGSDGSKRKYDNRTYKTNETNEIAQTGGAENKCENDREIVP